MNWRSVFIFLAVAVLPAVRAGLAQCLAEGAGELAERDGSAWEDAVTLQNNWRDEGPAPAAVVLPSSTAEVSRAIKCANEHGVRVTARCGSHGQAGAGVLLGAITLDLRNMGAVRVSPDGSRAYIGGGARMGDVYDAIATATNNTKGLPGGTCPGVGAGGHLQGGGQGNLVRSYGLAYQRLRSAEVVDAEGRVLRADSTQNSDLFWALRGGGGGSWGIVTEYEVEPVDVPPVVTQIALAAPDGRLPEFVDWFMSTMSPGLPDSWSPFLIWQNSSAVVVGINLDGEAATRAMLEQQGLGKAPEGTQADLEEMSWLESVAASAGLNSTDQLPDREEYDPVYRSQVKSFYLKEAAPLPAGARAALVQFLQQTPGAAAYFQLMGGAVNEPKPDDAANPWTRQAFSVTLEVQWDEGGQPAPGALAALAAAEARMAEELPEVLTTGYINYLDVDLDRWQALARYAGPNAARLVAVKRRYDPHNFFRNPWSVPLTLEPPSAAVAAEDARQREQPGGA